MAKIQLSDDFLLSARQHADVFRRTVSTQIEHWSRIGKIVVLKERKEAEKYFIYTSLVLSDILSLKKDDIINPDKEIKVKK